jgi:hypothetical protein
MTFPVLFFAPEKVRLIVDKKIRVFMIVSTYASEVRGG